MILRSIFLAVSLAIGAVHAQELTSASLLEKMNKAYSSVKTAKYSVEAKGYTEEGTIKLDILFAAPTKIKATVSGMMGADSKTVFQTTGDQVTITDATGKGEKQTVEFDMMRLPTNLEGLCFWDHKVQLSTAEGGNMKDSTLKVIQKESWNGKDWIVLEEDAPQMGVEVRYFIDPKTFFIWRTVMKNKDGNGGTDTWLTKLELDAKIDEKEFSGL